jgi:hypothetical protein
MSNCVNVSVTVQSCKESERKRKANFEVPYYNMWECGPVLMGKGDFP